MFEYQVEKSDKRKKKKKVFNLYWIIFRVGMEIHSSVFLGRDAMNNNFKFKMNPYIESPKNWKQTIQPRHVQWKSQSAWGQKRL